MDVLAKQRERRRLNGNAVTKRYEKTPKGYLMRKYRNMQSRVTGVQWKKSHLYGGLELLSRDDFYKWAFKDDVFLKMFEEYNISGYDRRLAPSVDRINPDLGYTIENMRWLTHSENSKQTRRWDK
jgi:hypothetical protein